MNSEKIILHIDSRYRDAGFSPESFEITLHETLQRVKYSEVISVEIPYTFYIINQFNNVFKFVVGNAGGAAYSVAVPPGNYTPQQLAQRINSMILELYGNQFVEVSYAKEKYKFVFTPTNATLFIQAASDGCTIAEIMGISSTLTVTLGFGAESQNIANLAGPNYILIRSNILTRPKIIRPFLNSSQDNILYKLPITGNPGSILIEKNLYPSKISYGVRQKIKKLDFELVDPDGNVVDLNGQNWSISLVLETA